MDRPSSGSMLPIGKAKQRASDLELHVDTGRTFNFQRQPDTPVAPERSSSDLCLPIQHPPSEWHDNAVSHTEFLPQTPEDLPANLEESSTDSDPYLLPHRQKECPCGDSECPANQTARGVKEMRGKWAALPTSDRNIEDLCNALPGCTCNACKEDHRSNPQAREEHMQWVKEQIMDAVRNTRPDSPIEPNPAPATHATSAKARLRRVLSLQEPIRQDSRSSARSLPFNPRDAGAMPNLDTVAAMAPTALQPAGSTIGPAAPGDFLAIRHQLAGIGLNVGGQRTVDSAGGEERGNVAGRGGAAAGLIEPSGQREIIAEARN